MIEGLSASSAFVQERLAAVLRVAMGTPGHGPRLRAAGLVASSPHLADKPSLVADWTERFAQIPVLTKAEMRQRPGQFLASVAAVAYRGSTSGSRGQAYEFFAGPAWNRARIQAREQGLAWWGITPEVPILNLNSRLMPGRRGDLALGGPLTAAMLAGLIDSLRHSPMALRGYPSRLCEVAAELPGTLPPVRAVICTGEPLFDHQKQLLAATFQAPVVNEYGCHESAAFGMTCPEAGRLHLDEHRCFYEILDHHLITTDLWNETMPLIRYQSGDLVQSYATPCPCGRPGPTVDILGRMEDRVTTLKGLVPTGKVPLPPLPGILHYRIQRVAPGQVLAWAMGDSSRQGSPSPDQGDWPASQSGIGKTRSSLQPMVGARFRRPSQPGISQPDFVPPQSQAALKAASQDTLKAWVQNTFGPSAVAITWAESSLAAPIPPVPWTDQQWQTVVTQQSLGAWLQAGAMPTGEAQATAALLKALVSPTVVGQPLPWVIQQKMVHLAEASPMADPKIEMLRWRVLLLATSVLPQSEAVALYGQVLARLQAMDLPLPAAARLDSLIPSLHLPTGVTAPAWANLMASHRHDLWDVWTLDPLNAHHLLAAFDGVIHRQAPAQRPPVAQALTPLLAVLVGDLQSWAAEFTLAHLLHWIALVQGPAPVGFTNPAATQPPRTDQLSPFGLAWLTWRQRLIQRSSALGVSPSNCDSALGQDSVLGDDLAADWHRLKTATPPNQQARLWIERGYGQRVQGQPLDPAQWLPVLDTYVPGWLDPTQPCPAHITPWRPIVQALAQPLHDQGRVDWAYRCLQVAALDPRQHTAFAALTQTHNPKHAVLVDLLPWPGAEG